MEILLTKKQIKITLPVLWALFVVLSLTNTSLFGVLNVVGVMFLFFVPGWLSLNIVNLTSLNFWKKTIFSLSLSIFFLMFFGFLWNTLAPFERPLDKHSSLLLVSFIFWFLFLFSHKKIKGIKISFSKYLFFNSFYDAIFVFVSIFFVFTSIFFGNGKR